jgi:DNA relaxase NicK
MIRFDAYSATTTAANHQQLVQLLVDQAGLFNVGFSQGKGFHTFGERIAVKDASGAEYGSVMWGGKQGDRCMIEVKGEHTPSAVEALRSRFHHRVTRVDSCADFDAPGAFEALLGPCTEVKKAHRLKGSKAGDWDDYPEDGRTFYIGSTASAVRVRLYEKGKQPEYRHLGRDHWTRIEIQARPSKDAKAGFAHLSPTEVWGASGWTRELAGRVLAEHVDPHPAGTTYRLTERDSALRWMCKQYGAHLLSLAQDLGSWDCLGLTLREMIEENSKKNGH